MCSQNYRILLNNEALELTDSILFLDVTLDKELNISGLFSCPNVFVVRKVKKINRRLGSARLANFSYFHSREKKGKTGAGGV